PKPTAHSPRGEDMLRTPTQPRNAAPDAPSGRSTPNRRRRDPLDGSTTGTIGGGGPQSGGRAQRSALPETPRIKPENAASGRLEPDPLGASVDHDDLETGPTDVSNASSRTTSDSSGHERSHRH